MGRHGREDTRPKLKLHRAAAVLSSHCRHADRQEPGLPYPAMTGPLGGLLYLENEEMINPKGVCGTGRPLGLALPHAPTLPHNPGTPRWHAGVRDGRAGVGGVAIS